MSLLDDVSIVITPNAYKAGTLYGVIPVPTEGAEEVVNGDFATDSDWTIGGTTFSAGAILLDNANEYVFQGWTDTVNTLYKLTITKTGLGTLRFRSGFAGSAATKIEIPESGIIYFTSTSDTNRIQIYGDENSINATLNSVSVKEYTSSDMDVTRATAATRVDENGLVNYAEILGGDMITDGNFSSSVYWNEQDVTNEISGNQAIWTSSPHGQGFKGANANDNIFTLTKIYQVTYTIDYITSGKLRTRYPFIGATYDSTGTYPLTITETGEAINIDIFIQNLDDSGNPTTAAISNISVKEVTRDNVPRIDYTGGGCPHILVEPQRTNLLRYSEDFSEWNMNGTSRVDGGVSSIGLNYYTITNTGGGFLGVYYASAGFSHGDTITASVYVKKGTSDSFTLRYGASINQNVEFDLDDGTIVSEGTNVVGTIQSMSDGWYRVTSTWTDASHTFSVADVALYVQSGNVEISGAQCEVGSYATSYIPNFGTASGVTRNEDIFTRDGIGSLINSPEGVFFVEMAALSDDGTSRYISISDGSTTNYVYFRFMSTSNRVLTRTSVAGVTINTFQKTISDTTDFNKFAFKWKSGDYALWINGVEEVVGTEVDTFTSGDLHTIKFGFPSSGGELYAKVKQLQVYDTALTDEQLLQLTGESGTDFYESYAEMAAALTYTLQ